MTWDEFKAAIDQQLSDQGKDGSVGVWYIDVSYPQIDNEMHKYPNVTVESGELHITTDMR